MPIITNSPNVDLWPLENGIPFLGDNSRRENPERNYQQGFFIRLSASHDRWIEASCPREHYGWPRFWRRPLVGGFEGTARHLQEQARFADALGVQPVHRRRDWALLRHIGDPLRRGPGSGSGLAGCVRPRVGLGRTISARLPRIPEGSSARPARLAGVSHCRPDTAGGARLQRGWLSSCRLSACSCHRPAQSSRVCLLALTISCICAPAYLICSIFKEKTNEPV